MWCTQVTLIEFKKCNECRGLQHKFLRLLNPRRHTCRNSLPANSTSLPTQAQREQPSMGRWDITISITPTSVVLTRSMPTPTTILALPEPVHLRVISRTRTRFQSPPRGAVESSVVVEGSRKRAVDVSATVSASTAKRGRAEETPATADAEGHAS